jgi:hypothetical protein
MNYLLRYLKDLEYLIYIVLGAFAVWNIRKFILAWEELRAAAFGLERESAQQRLNRSAALLVILLFLASAEFGLVSFIIPALPEVEPIPTATLDLLATPTITVFPTDNAGSGNLPGTPIPGNDVVQSGCVPDQLDISYPENDSTVNDIVEVEGTVDIPDFGFYKFEISRGETENWLTIQAGDTPKVDEKLGFWDTTQLEPDNYYLRLVVIDNLGVQREPCVVYLYVDKPSE